MLRDALRRDSEAIRRGDWKAFGALPIGVDTPPRWHKDYLDNVDLTTNDLAFALNHRALPDGGDIKLIWELSRWYQLVRLAQAGYCLGDLDAAVSCLRWLQDWHEKNPPFRGWNWTSSLEAGIRLIQFAWIDALLRETRWQVPEKALKTLDGIRHAILPAHIWFVWRYRSFGSSANNHLLGELAGLALALTRWNGGEAIGPSLTTVQSLWEREVLGQFAPDGGNREQALNYHLFSWEFCWQTLVALETSGHRVSSSVKDRLAAAACFFVEVQVEEDRWDYGDSDDAFVTPLFVEEARAVTEWWRWLQRPAKSPGLEYWWKPSSIAGLDWPLASSANFESMERMFRDSGIFVWRDRDWMLRWDLSPLGYLETAAHGHLDALHLSIWYRGVAIVIDPGTGGYYADPELREHLASWEAHNGPRLGKAARPRREGTFLWGEPHTPPMIEGDGIADGLVGKLDLGDGTRLQRRVKRREGGYGFRVDDTVLALGAAGLGPLRVTWQFAPGSEIDRSDSREIRVRRQGQALTVRLDSQWDEIEVGTQPRADDWNGICSPRFRQTETAPYLKLTARRFEDRVFATTFISEALP